MQWVESAEILIRKGVNWKKIRLFKNLYMGQKVRTIKPNNLYNLITQEQTSH